jgi:putative transcription factor
MQCELCGRDSGCRPATVDGVRMMLCPNCLNQHGKRIQEPIAPRAKNVSSTLPKQKKPVYRDIYKDMKTDRDLVSDWNERITDARKKKGLTREQLGFKIGERTVTVGKIENGDLRPSDDLVKKIEKELEITLFEEVKEVSKLPHSSGSQGMTLGDFIKKE